MTAVRRYDEVVVGEAFPREPLEFQVTSDRVKRFLAATGDESGRYGANEGAPAPSTLASVYLIDLLTARGSPPGGIHAKQAIRFHRQVRVGETLHIQGFVREKYLRKERPYVVADFEARDSGGALVSSGRVTSIWGRDP